MRTEEYKELMGEVNMTPRLKEKIMQGAALEREPKPLGQRRSRPRLMRIVSVAATIAVLAAVVTAFVLIVRFVGPERPVKQPDGSLGSIGMSNSTEFELISVSTDCEGVTAEVVGFDRYNSRMEVVFQTANGAPVYIYNQSLISLLYHTGTEWTDAPIYKTPYIAEPAVHIVNSPYVIDQLKRFSTHADGRYRLEQPFGLNESTNMPYTLTVEFRLGECALKANSIYSTCEGVSAEIAGYDEKNGRMTIRWLIDESVTVRIYDRHYKLSRLTNGSEMDMTEREGSFPNYWPQMEYETGAMDVFDLCANYYGIGAGSYTLKQSFSVDGQSHTLFVSFGLSKAPDAAVELEPCVPPELGLDFEIISILGANDVVETESIRYYDGNKAIAISWKAGDEPVTHSGSYVLEKRVGVAWQQLADVDFDHVIETRQNEEWEEIYSLSTYFPEVTAGVYRLTKPYTLGGKSCVLVIEFMLTEVSDHGQEKDLLKPIRYSNLDLVKYNGSTGEICVELLCDLQGTPDSITLYKYEGRIWKTHKLAEGNEIPSAEPTKGSKLYANIGGLDDGIYKLTWAYRFDAPPTSSSVYYYSTATMEFAIGDGDNVSFENSVLLACLIDDEYLYYDDSIPGVVTTSDFFDLYRLRYAADSRCLEIELENKVATTVKKLNVAGIAGAQLLDERNVEELTGLTIDPMGTLSINGLTDGIYRIYAMLTIKNVDIEINLIVRVGDGIGLKNTETASVTDLGNNLSSIATSAEYEGLSAKVVGFNAEKKLLWVEFKNDRESDPFKLSDAYELRKSNGESIIKGGSDRVYTVYAGQKMIICFDLSGWSADSGEYGLRVYIQGNTLIVGGPAIVLNFSLLLPNDK